MDKDLDRIYRQLNTFLVLMKKLKAEAAENEEDQDRVVKESKLLYENSVKIGGYIKEVKGIIDTKKEFLKTIVLKEEDHQKRERYKQTLRVI